VWEDVDVLWDPYRAGACRRGCKQEARDTAHCDGGCVCHCDDRIIIMSMMLVRREKNEQINIIIIIIIIILNSSPCSKPEGRGFEIR
jgi:hypothetical protein